MADPSNLPAIQDRPPLPEHQIEVWDRLCARMTDCASRRGVYLLLCGWSYRQSADAVGIDHSCLTDAANRYGLRDAIHTTGRAIINHRAIEIAATEEMLDRARNGKLADESLRDLAVTAGISRDKVRDFEKGQQDHSHALSFLEQIAGGLRESGMRLDLTLSPAGGSEGENEGIVPLPHPSPETPS